MVEVILYTFIELLNFYAAYRFLLGTRFTAKKWRYGLAIMTTCMVQVMVLYLGDDTSRDIIVLGMGLLCALFLAEKKHWKVGLFYPLVWFVTSMINTLASYGIAFLLGITQKEVGDSIGLTLLSECAGIIFCLIYGRVVSKRKQKETSLTAGQYLFLIVGGLCFFVVIGFAQVIAQGEILLVYRRGDVVAVSCVLIAACFVLLSIWQRITWKRAMTYQMENEKYALFLAGQEEYIRMLIVEDEKRRKLRHDMNAHMLAMETMIEGEEWEQLRKYIGDMKGSLEEVAVSKYTGMSAVDAIIAKWHQNAREHQVEWCWQGKVNFLNATSEISIFEWCTLFSNLLSNASEAVQNLQEEKRIEIKISEYQGKILLMVGNTCSRELSANHRPETTKQDKEYHGYGLKNVEEVVKKHEGDMDYEVKDGWFQIHILL